jgi:cytoplasmic FMR1 interacting protein
VIYENQLRVLAPEIEKLKGLMQYQQRTISSLSRHATNLCISPVPPTPSLLGKLVDLLDLLSLLDTLKVFVVFCSVLVLLKKTPQNMKACLNNDFSFYKRAFGFLKRSMQPEEEAFNQMLHLFLANQSSITHNLKTELHKIPNVEELLLLLIQHCEEHVVATKYVLPNERFSLLRVIPYVMFLLDGEHCNVFSHKSVNWSRLKQLFKGFGLCRVVVVLLLCCCF